MGIATDLNCKIPVQTANSANLKEVFKWYVSLKIPYETLSNIKTNVFIKNASQMLLSVINGGGGHCVEHSVLLAALLNDLGFTARVINADYHNHTNNQVIRISKPFVAILIDEDMWVCDPYYRTIILPIPKINEICVGHYVVCKHNEKEFSISKVSQGKIIDEDRANLDWTIETRRQQFEERYVRFSPFGITAPFFQMLEPKRNSIFYSPKQDCLIAVSGNSYQYIEETELDSIEWVPKHISYEIISVLPDIKKQRDEAIKFLDTNLFPPHYENLIKDN